MRPHHDQLGARRGRARDDLGVGAADQHRAFRSAARPPARAPPRRAARRRRAPSPCSCRSAPSRRRSAAAARTPPRTATCTRSTVALAPCASAIAVASASADGSEKSVGTRMRLTLRRSMHLKLATSPRRTTPGSACRLDAPPGHAAGRRHAQLTVAPRIRSFICLNAHPAGCAANVDARSPWRPQVRPAAGSSDALVIGASTGYGLSSLVTAVFGYGARATAVCLERPPQGDKTASAGWYNLAAVAARWRARAARTIVGDQRRRVLRRVKHETLARLPPSGAKLDLRRLQPGRAQAHRRAPASAYSSGAEADRRAVPQQEHQPRQRSDRPRSRSRRRTTPRSRRRAR